MMKLIVAGSRGIEDYAWVEQELDEYFLNANQDLTDIEIVSGNAHGPDQLGEQYAKENDIKLKVFPADWDTHGKSAGYIRNGEMAEYATHLIAFWDGKSRGTKHMIETAQRKGLDVYICQKV